MIKIDTELCKGCGLCVDTCPKKILIIDPNIINLSGYNVVSIINLDKCTQCSLCAIRCPDLVFTIEKGDK